MADFEISVGINAKKTKDGAKEATTAIKSVGDEAEKTGRKAKSAADRDLSSLNKHLDAAKEFAAAAGAAFTLFGAAIGAVALAATKLVAITIQLSKNFADYAKSIGRAQEMTGLATTTLSALRLQSEKAGGSFEELGEGLKNFARLIGEANNGQKEASAKMARLGLDARKAASDMDGAFRQVLKKILELPAGVQQANAAIDAFGEQGYKLLPFIRSFNGDIDELIKKAEELGVVLSQHDVRAAKEFNDTLFEVQTQVRGVAYSFGRELMPEVSRVLKGINGELKNNKSEVQSWAETTGNFVHRIITIFNDTANSIERLRNGTHSLSTGYDILIGVLMAGMPALQAAVFLWERWANATKEISRKGGAERAAIPLRGDAGGVLSPSLGGIDFFGGPAAGPGRGGGSAAPRKSPQQQQAEDLQKIIKDLNLEIQFFGQSSKEAGIQQQLMRMEVTAANQALADQATALAKQIDTLDAAAKAAKEAKDARERLDRDFAKERAGLTNSSFGTNVGIGAEINRLKEELKLGRELTAVEQHRVETAGQRLVYERELQIYGYTQAQIDELLSIFDIEQQRTAEILKQLQALRDRKPLEEQYKAVIQGLDSEITDLTIQLQEYNTGLQASRLEILMLTEAYKKLTPEQQAAARAKAEEIDALRASIKAQEDARQAYDDVYQTIRGHLQVLSEEGFGGFFKSIYRQFKQFLTDMVAQWLTSKFFQLFFKGGNQQQAAANGQGNGGIFGGIFNAIFGQGGMGPGGTPMFNFAGTGGQGNSGGLAALASLGAGVHGGSTGNSSASGIGGILGNIKGLFGPQKNILTGKSSSLAGKLGGIGAIMSVVGGFIPGKAGGVISMAGTGMSIGAMFGPWGAAIGAGIGALIGLFGGDPKRKRDKREKLPALQQGFTDALRDLRQLLQDVRTLRVDPDTALTRADELRSQIATGFGIQFESKKYRKQAQSLIRTRLTEADALIAEIRTAAEVARAAGERERRIIPEFAGGVFMSSSFARQLMDFKRRNGMLPGRFTGLDTMPAMLAPGEMVLNPAQQARVRSNAGSDPFVGAGIPGYAGGIAMQSAASAPIEIHLTPEISIDAEGMVRMNIKHSTNVQREIKVVMNDAFANDEVKTKRRGS